MFVPDFTGGTSVYNLALWDRVLPVSHQVFQTLAAAPNYSAPTSAADNHSGVPSLLPRGAGEGRNRS